MHQLPLALFQPEDHRDSQSDCPFTARQLRPLYLEDVGDIGSRESRDLLIDTTAALDKTCSTVRFLLNGLPTTPVSPKRIRERDVVAPRPKSLLRFRITSDDSIHRPVRSLNHVIKVWVPAVCHDGLILHRRSRHWQYGCGFSGRRVGVVAACRKPFGYFRLEGQMNLTTAVGAAAMSRCRLKALLRATQGW